MMKYTNGARGKLVALGLAVACALPVAAQTTTQSGGTSGAAGSTTPMMTTDRRDNDNNWGWLGLIGLAGLAGLMRKKDAHDMDRRTTATSTGAVR